MSNSLNLLNSMINYDYVSGSLAKPGSVEFDKISTNDAAVKKSDSTQNQPDQFVKSEKNKTNPTSEASKNTKTTKKKNDLAGKIITGVMLALIILPQIINMIKLKKQIPFKHFRKDIDPSKIIDISDYTIEGVDEFGKRFIEVFKNGKWIETRFI